MICALNRPGQFVIRGKKNGINVMPGFPQKIYEKDVCVLYVQSGHCLCLINFSYGMNIRVSKQLKTAIVCIRFRI